jgi:hypothetical protein
MFLVRPTFKLVFFDRSIIRRNWNKINDRPLRRAGALVRRIARSSIKRDTRKRMLKSGKRGKFGNPSAPGSPPYSRAPGAPFKLIFNVPGFMNATELVGMVGFGNPTNPIPGLHEHGGRARRLVFTRSTHRRKRGGSRVMRSVRYPMRPFMWPALLKAKDRLPEFWKNSVGNVRS